jgi:hypothetical protein
MSLLEPFSKPRWQHRKPEVRLAAMDEIDDEDVLMQVLQTDEDDAVRSRALARIQSGETLERLIDDMPDWCAPALREQARAQRLRQLVPTDGELPADLGESALLRIANLADDHALIESAIRRIESVEVLVELASHHALARARLAAAQRIEDIDTLQELAHKSRHRDKAVFRHCREKLDEHLAVQRAAEQRRQDLEHLAEEAAALRSAVDSPDYRVRYLSLKTRWDDLADHADPEQRPLIQGDLDICARRIEEKEAEAAAEAEQEAVVDQARATFAEVLSELETLQPEVLAPEGKPVELEGRLNALEERWVAALQHAQPEAGRTEACKALLGQWRAPLVTLNRLTARQAELKRLAEAIGHLDPADFKAIEKLQKQAGRLAKALPWPADLDAVRPEALGSLQEQQEMLVQRLAALQEKKATTQEKVDAAFEAFREELATNHFRNADRALNKLRNLLRQLPPARQEHYQHELQPLLVRLREIHDWQGFAIEPKKRELIEQMKALAGGADDVDELAARIKTLQKEWKALGPLSPRRDQALWAEFSAAADEAWAPCKEVFGQRAEARKQNFRQRMAMVAQLVEYEQKIAWPDLENPDPDLPAPDWKMVRKTLQTARKAISEVAPVDRKQERKSHRALDKVCNRIFAHLEKEYSRNVAAKEALVAEAQTLAEMEDLRRAIDRAKAIQREWKDIGVTPARADRTLWKRLRKACDAVFARLGEEREQRNAEHRARIEARRAAEKARGEQAAARKRQKQERWQRLLDRLQACAIKADDSDKAGSLWGEGEDLPRGIDAEALETWWNDGTGDSDGAACREACIALEVLAGRESPPEDNEARMAYQMKRLVEGMGGQHENDRQRLLDIVNGYIALRPAGDTATRFGEGLRAAANLEK